MAAMTVLSQSQPETQSPIGPPSSPPKRQTIIGCWNVRTMAETKRAGQVAKEMKGYWIKVVTGIDEVCPELLRADMGDTARRVTSGHKKLWETLRWPKLWKKELVLKVIKRGSFHECNSWRGLTLLPVISRIFCRMRLEQINKGIDKKL